MITTEDILDLLSTLILGLGSIREQTVDAIDRAAINNQIMALTKLWRKIDDAGAYEPDEQLSASKSALEGISIDLKKRKEKIGKCRQVDLSSGSGDSHRRKGHDNDRLLTCRLRACDYRRLEIVDVLGITKSGC